MKKILSSIVLVLMACSWVMGQNEKVNIDSLEKVFLTCKEDTNKVNTSYQIAKYFLNISKFDSSLKYSTNAFKLSKEINYVAGKHKSLIAVSGVYIKKGEYLTADSILEITMGFADEWGEKHALIRTLNSQAIVYRNQGKILKAIEIFTTISEISTEIKDSVLYAQSLLNLGYTFSVKGDYLKGNKLLHTSLSIAKSLKNKQLIGGTLLNLAVIEQNRENYKVATKYYSEALFVFKELEEKQAEAMILGNMRYLFMNIKQYDSAKFYGEQSIKLNLLIKDKHGLITDYNAVGILLEKKGSFQKAIEMYKKALVLCDEVGNKKEKINLYQNYGIALQKQGEYRKAQKRIEKALFYAQEYEMKNEEYLATHQLAIIHELLVEYKIANDYRKKEIILSNDLFESEKEKQIEDLNIQYNTKEVEQKNILLTQKAEQEAKEKKYMIYFSVIVILLFIIAVIAVYFMFRAKQTEKKAKEKEREYANNLQIAYDDLEEKKKAAEKAKKLETLAKEEAEKQRQLAEEKTEEAEAQRDEVEKQKRIVEEQRDQANKQRKIADTAKELASELRDTIRHHIKNDKPIFKRIHEFELEKMLKDYQEGDKVLKKNFESLQNISWAVSSLYDVILDETTNLDVHNMQEVVPHLCDLLISIYGNKNITYEVTGNLTTLNGEVKRDFLELIVELVRNSVKYAFPNHEKGLISIDISLEGDNIDCTYCDNGIGFPEPVAEGKGTQIIKNILSHYKAQPHIKNNEQGGVFVHFNYFPKKKK